MYKTLHKKQGSVTVQLRFARSSVTFCAKRDNIGYIAVYEEEKRRVTICSQEFSGQKILFDTVEKRILPIWNAEHRQNSVIVYMIW